jgi:hypothetical protein
MKIFKYIIRDLIALLMIGGFFSIHVMASPHDQTGDFPQKKYQDPLDFPEEETSLLTPQADMALPAHFSAPTETFLVSLVHIEVDSTAKLKTLQELGFACNQLGACDVEIDQAALTTLKLLGFKYEILRDGVAVRIAPRANAPDALINSYGGNDTDYAIPDSTQTTCGNAYSGVNINDAPAGALVDYVEYRIRVLHTFPSDLRLYISSQTKYELVWDFLGGSDDGGKDDDVENDDDIYLNHRLINTTFDGEPVNQSWFLDAYDCVEGDTGTIDYMEVWIWYDDGGGAKPNLTPYSPPDWDFPIVPSSVSGTNTVNDLFTTKTTYIDWAVINNGSANIVPGFSSCLLFDSSTSPLSCWDTPDGLLSDYYAFIKDWVLNITPSVGWHTLSIQVDYYNTVIESNENDNIWSYQFYWNPTQRKIYLPFVSRLKPVFEGPFELEPNNKYTQANGPINSGQNYQGYPDDANDYFSFTTGTTGDIAINLSNHIGSGVQVILYYQSTDQRVEPVCQKPDGGTTCAITYPSRPGGLYYLRIYSVSGYNNTTPYTLRVTYP